MNLIITTSSIDSAATQASAPVLPSAEQAGLFPQAVATLELDLAGALPFAQLPVLQFGQWLDQAAAVVDVPADGAADAAASNPDALFPLPEQQAGEEAPVADLPLLSAMAMPVLPLAQAAQATLAAVAAALPGAQPSSKPEVTAAASPAVAPAGANTALLDTSAQPANLPAADVPVQTLATATAPAALPRADAAVQDAATGAKSQSQAQPAANATNATNAAFASALSDAAKEQPAAAGAERTAVTSAVMSNAGSQNASAAADTVTLSGPPTAWRQNLREALGERLQLQVGRSAEQAVIRLDPPNLGQVEIAIRHSAGTLEVTISATHREVVRQLQAVSESLRSDLAQRQFTDVAVNVAPARSGGQAMPSFGGDQQGRGRQQDGQQDDAAPGLALAEAQQGSSGFSLNA